jgi:hypothetical protein
MFSTELKESKEKEITINETNVDAFKIFLKTIYFDEFDSKEIKDYLVAIEVFKLAHSYEIHMLSNIVEELIIEIVSFENALILIDFALVYDLNNLIKFLELFMKDNEKQLVEKEVIEKQLNIFYTSDKMERFIELANLSQSLLIWALTHISKNNIEVSDENLSPIPIYGGNGNGTGIGMGLRFLKMGLSGTEFLGMIEVFK